MHPPEIAALALAAIPIFYYLYREMRPRMEDRRQVRSYLEETFADPDVAFHREFSTLPISYKDADGVDDADVLRVLLQKLRDNDLDWTLLVGDLGAGKTATLSMLFVKIAELYLARKVKAIPILIRMRENWTPTDVEASLRRYIEPRVLRRLMKRRVQLVLLLDSLDEFAIQYGQALTLRQITENVLHSPFLKKCILITATRPNVIADLDQLAQYKHVFPYQYQLLDLQYADVVKYVRTKGREQSFNALGYEARRILSKPLFLYFFVTGPQGITFSDEAQLYDRFFAEWYSRAQVQMGLENPLPDINVVREFLELVAIESASSLTGSLSENQIRIKAAKLVESNADLVPFLNDIFGQAKMRWLLVPRTEGGLKGYRFIHPSLADYFLSGPISQSYLNGNPSDLVVPRFGELVPLFVRARIVQAGNLAEIVQKNIPLLNGSAEGLAGIHTAISVITWLEHGVDALRLDTHQTYLLQRSWTELAKSSGDLAVAVRRALRRIKLPQAVLNDISLQDYDLSQGSDLCGARLTGCSFVGTKASFKLSAAKLDRAIVSNCNFTNVEFIDTSLTETIFKNCRFESCNLLRARAGGSHFEMCYFRNDCDLTSADFSRAEFRGGAFEDCRLVGATMDNCSAQGLVLRRCDLYQMSITKFPRKSINIEDCDNVPAHW